MQHRELGKTGLQASAVGLGCGTLSYTPLDYAAQVVRRAYDLGVTYFDTARAYGDSEIKLGIGLQGVRDQVVISTKTGKAGRDEAWQQINESLQRLQTDYVDNCHLHALAGTDDINERCGADGALRALLQAKDEGMVRHIGCTAHRSDILIEALNRFPFDVILVPMNIVEREPLAELIPLCHKRGVGVTIMKPLATGLLPASLALKWLLTQPIDSCVPGATTLEEVTENSLAGHRDAPLTDAEQQQIDALYGSLEHVRCRICAKCLPCPKNIDVPISLGTDVMYDYYRNWGADAFRRFGWGRPALERDATSRPERIALLESCDRCGDCERRCPYGLPVVDMLQATLPAMRDMVRIYGELLVAA